MKLNLASLKKPFARLGDHDPSKVKIAPYRDWAVMFSVLVFFAVIVVVIHGILLVRINNGDIFQAPSSQASTSHKLNTKALDATIRFFDQKQQKFDAVLGITPSSHTAASSSSAQ